jgi:hypothetical protein
MNLSFPDLIGRFSYPDIWISDLLPEISFDTSE